MRYDLIDLKLFLDILDAGSITHGAERSHLALASASARLKGLEESLGTPLFERQRHGVRPTPAGRALAHHARAVTHQLELMADELGDFATGLRARVRLLGNTAALAEHLPGVLGDFLLMHPQIDLDIEEKPSHAIVEALTRGQADLGVLADSADMTGLEARPFRVDRLLLVTRLDDGSLDGDGPLHFEQLLGHAFVGLGRDNPLQQHIAGKALNVGRHLELRLRVSDFDTVCSLVARGVGIALVPEAALQRARDRHALRALPLADAWATRHLHLCAMRFDALTPPAARLAQALLAG